MKKNLLLALGVMLAFFALGTPRVDAVATWTQRTAAGSRAWSSITSSSDGAKLAAGVNGGYIYTSADYGATWTAATSAGSHAWAGIASSSDGTKLAAVDNGGYAYTSTDSGSTWIQQTSSGIRAWSSIASSSDGLKLAAAVSGGYIYTSTDGGATWVQRTASGIRNWLSISSSTDGLKLFSGDNMGTGKLYTSTDGGANWTVRLGAGSGLWGATASSGDGVKLVSGRYGGNISTSTNGGSTWTIRTAAGAHNWKSITSSADGTQIGAVVDYGGAIYLSGDSGATWTSPAAPGLGNWQAITSSSDGAKLAAAMNGGYIWTLADLVSPTVVTTAATAVAITGATLNGDLTSLGGFSSADVYFKYSTTSGFTSGSTTTPSTTVSAIGPFSAPISGLVCNTTYYFRAYADVSSTTVSGVELSFTTPICAPTITTTAATSVTATTAALGYTLADLGGAATTVNFDFGTTTSYGYTLTTAPTFPPTTVVPTGGTMNVIPGVVTPPLSGLSCSTLYHYRAKATNSAGTGYGADMVFTTLSCSPTVTTVSMSDTISTPHYFGNLTSLGGGASATVGFEYGTTASYGITSGTLVMTVPGLFDAFATTTSPYYSCGTLYHFRAFATTSTGTAYGADMTFTSGACPAVVTLPATSITVTSATLNGDLTVASPLPSATPVYFTISAPAGPIIVTTLSGLSVPGTFSYSVTELTCNTSYTFAARTYVSSGGGGITYQADGAILSFTTLPCPPTVVTTPATAVASTSATLNGDLSSLGTPATNDVYFKYSTTSGFTSGATTTSSITVSTAGPFSAPLSGLACGTTYYFRAYADGGVAGTVIGAELSFTTSLCLPAVTTDVAVVTGLTASLADNITNFGGDTSVTSGFDYGTTTAYGSVSSVITIPSSVGIPNTNNVIVSGLSCGTTYHYRAWATNFVGTAHGADMTFVTDACPLSIVTTPATVIAMTSATLNGDLTSIGGLPSTGVLFRYSTTSGFTSGGVTTPLITVTSTGPFNTPITGLLCNTTYYFRAYVTATSTTVDGGELSFTTSPCFSTVITSSSSAITATDATLTGTLVDLGGDASVALGFAYSTDMSFGATIVGTPGTLTAPGTFTSALTGLSCNTTYNFKAYATNSGGTHYGAVLTFTTSPCSATVVTSPAVVTSMTGATLNGDLTSLGGAASATLGFEYGLTASLGTSVSGTPATLSATGTFDAPVSGLVCGTTYSFRAYATTSVGTVYGAVLTFTTTPCPPVVVTTAATGVLSADATLNGDLTSLGSFSSATVYFRYSTASGFTTGAITTSSVSVSSTGPFNTPITGLACNTTYYFRAYADDGSGIGGPSIGAELSFTTLPCAATVNTDPATLITPVGAVLVGTLVNLGGAPSATLGFDYSTDLSFSSTIVGLPSSSIVPAGFSSVVSGLSCNTTYNFRAYATTSAGTAHGAPLTFTTAFCLPAVTTLPPAGVSTTTATMQGLVASLGGAPSAATGFEYGLTTAYGTTVTGPTATGLVPFSNVLTGLSCGTTYHFRAYITNSAGTSYGLDMPFTTSTCPPPVVTTVLAVAVTTTTATLNGNLVSLATASSADVYFRYGTASGFTTGATTTPSSPFTAPGPFFQPLTGLACNTTYYFRAYADGGVIGTGIGAELSFTTGMCLPTVVTNPAVSIGTNSATLSGELINLGGAPSAFVQLNYGTSATALTVIAASSTFTIPNTLAAIITTMPCGTTMYYQASATTVVGTAYGAIVSFDTLACGVPVVATVGSSGIAPAWATLSGNLTGLGGYLGASVGFNYGTTLSYGSTVVGAPSPSSGGTFTAFATGLSCNTLYHYRATATNFAGTGYGSDMTFTSGPCPPVVVTTSATSIGLSTATLNGTLTSLGTAPSASVYFKYSTTSGFTTGAATTPGVTFSATGPFSSSLFGLACGTTYYFRAYADAGLAGIVNGVEMSFTTVSCSPIIVTDPATSITGLGATLNGHLVSLGASPSVMVGFEYGPTTFYGTSVSVLSPYTAPGPLALGSGLTCAMTYHYRTYAITPSGLHYYGADLTVTTGSCPLSVSTSSVSGGSGGAVLLNGNLISLGTSPSAVVGFQFGTSTSYGTINTVTPAMTAAGAFSYPKVVACGKTYHYRAYASGTSTVYGADQSFILPIRDCYSSTSSSSTTTSSSTTGGRGLIVYPPNNVIQAQVEYFKQVFTDVDTANVAIMNPVPYVHLSVSTVNDVGIQVGEPFTLNWETYQVTPGTCRGVSDPLTDGWTQDGKDPRNVSGDSEIQNFSETVDAFSDTTKYTIEGCTDLDGNILPNASVTVSLTRAPDIGRLRWRVY